jgi:hypothetical protein
MPISIVLLQDRSILPLFNIFSPLFQKPMKSMESTIKPTGITSGFIILVSQKFFFT